MQSWARRYAKLIIYYQGFGEEGNPFRLELYPKTRRYLRRTLQKHYFQEFAPGRHTRRHGKGSVAVSATSHGDPVHGVTACLTKSRAGKLGGAKCADIRGGHVRLTSVRDGHWFLWTRERVGGGRQCWQRPDRRARRSHRCGRVRVDTAQVTKVRWSLPATHPASRRNG